jgi:glycine/serine hydroxymethyltransferase
MGVAEMVAIGDAIARVLESRGDAGVQPEVRTTVAELCAAFPLPV